MRLILSLIFAPLFFATSSLAQEHFLPFKTKASLERSSAPALIVDATSKTIAEDDFSADFSTVETGNFLSLTPAANEIFRFTIASPSGTHLITMGKTAHNFLLRKTLLQKLGYTLPAMAHLPRIEIQFKDRTEKRNFIAKLEEQTGADTDRWVIEENKTKLVLQDVLIGEPLKGEPDLAAGALTRNTILGRAELEALIIPYTLTNVTESINLFSWISGTIYNEGVKVDYPNSDEFNPSAETIQEILGRIARLTRADWTEVAKSAKFPSEVETLLIEKLISRRNSFLELFSVEEAPLEFTALGQVTGKEWPGYATHFSYGNPESPLNPGEVFAFTKSGLFSTLLNNAVAKLNEIPVFRGDVQSFNEKLANLGNGGKNRSVPIGAWGFPFASGELIFSRNLVMGSFMGTENLLQLVDQFGIRLSLGAQLHVENLPVPVGVGMKGTVSISRTYAHLKPVKSVRKANRYGYQNFAVPFFIRSSANKLNPLFEDNFESLPEDQKLNAYQSALADFKQKIAPGESVIITDSLVGNGRLSASVNLYQLIDLSAAAEVSELVISRLHIYRKDENTFQVYKDFGAATQPSFGIEIGVRRPVPQSFLPVTFDKDAINSSTLPIIRAKWGKNLGRTTVQFYSIDFTDGKDPGQNLDESVARLKILQQTMLHTSTETLKKHVKPYLIENHFTETNTQERFLFFSNRRLKSVSDITVTAPDGERKKFVRDFFGKSDAFDFTNTTNNMLDFVSEMITHNKVDFGSDTSINPGYTSNGRAKNKLLNFEAEELPDGSLRDSFVKISHIHNGWKLSKKKIQKILDRFSREYGGNLFAPTALNETERMFLYRVSLDISLFEPAINHLLALTEEEIRILFAKYGINLDHRRVDDRIVKHLQRFKRNHSSKALMRAISIADRLLPAEGFIELLGGKENIFISARVDGFRKGDEKGDATILSNTIGVTGSSQTAGPLSAMREKLGMTEGEFLSLWILGRIL